MKYFFNMIITVFVLLIFAGCSSPKMIDTSYDRRNTVMDLDYRDFEKAARDAVASMLESGAVNKPEGGRYVLAISDIENKTPRRFDTDQLVKKIRVALLKSGKVVTTTAISGNGIEDDMTYKVRQLRQSEEFNQDNIAGRGEMIAPELSLSGKILQRDIKISKRKKQVEYYLQLTLTELKHGLALWENETLIVKEGSR